MESKGYGYARIRDEFLNYCYEFCRVKLNSSSGWVAHETPVDFAKYQFDGVFEADVDNLCLEVIALVLDAGRGSPDTWKARYDAAAELLNAVGERNLSILLDEDDAGDLRYDLGILGLMPIG